jgi:serine/threonine protein kinase
MSEVWRARETKLHREVAVKVLRQRFASDPDRLARFRRDAKTLASLNHPNIGHRVRRHLRRITNDDVPRDGSPVFLMIRHGRTRNGVLLVALDMSSAI